MTDFLADLGQIALQKLKAAGVGFDDNATLRELLFAYYTVDERRIAPQARSVHRAPEFNEAVAALVSTHAAAIAAIERKFSAGADVNGHVNRRSLMPHEPDELLVDWWIHHLHLSLGPHDTDRRFLGRTGPVAFVHVTEHDAYFLTVFDHGHWTDRSIFEILVRRFPEAVASFELRGIPPDPGITDEIIHACRKRGVAYVIAVDGRSYRPPSFAGSGALSVRAFQRAERTIREIKALQDAVIANMPKIRADAPAIGALVSPDFELFDGTNEWLVREKTSGQMIRINFQAG